MNPVVPGLARGAAGQPDGASDDEVLDLERKLAERTELKRQLARRAALLQQLDEKQAAREEPTESRPIVPAPRDGPLVCTYEQERSCFVLEVAPGLAQEFTMHFVLRLRGALDVGALRRALNGLVSRHEGLRTRVVEQGGLLRQVVDPPPADWPLPVTDLPADDVDRWATEQVHGELDVDTGPVFSAALARLAPHEHVLVVLVHHIAADGWSIRVLADELCDLYAAEITHTRPRLPDLPVQPADYAAWQHGWLRGAESEQQLDYWRRQLADLSSVDLPTDRPRPTRPTSAGAARSRRLSDDLAAAVATCARTHRASVLAVMYAALLTVLHGYTGRTDLPIGSVFSGRSRPETESLVADLANIVVLRTTLDGDPTFADLVERCRDTVLDAIAHQEIPFGVVVDALQPQHVVGRSPLLQVLLSSQPRATAVDRPVLGEVTTELVDIGSDLVPSDIEIMVFEDADGSVDLLLDYSTEMYDPDRIDRLVDDWLTALARGLAEPDRTATDLPVGPTTGPRPPTGPPAGHGARSSTHLPEPPRPVDGGPGRRRAVWRYGFPVPD